MQIYLVTDEKTRTHQFIYPDRVWEQTESGGWFSRQLERVDHDRRQAACFSLVRNAVSVRRLQAVTPVPVVASEEESNVVH